MMACELFILDVAHDIRIVLADYAVAGIREVRWIVDIGPALLPSAGLPARKK